MNKIHHTTVALVLAGGRSQRLSGADKGLIYVNQKPMALQVAECLAPHVDELLISANRNLSDYRAFGFKIVNDIDAAFHGPMAGIVSAITYIQNQPELTNASLLVAPCDTPNIPADYATRMLEYAEKDLLIAHDGQRLQNLHCLLSCRAQSSLLCAFTNGERALHKWYASQSIQQVNFSADADLFKNFNLPVDFA